ARSVTAARRTKAPGRNLGPSSWVKISTDETPPVGFAFMPPPRAAVSSEKPVEPDWVDILPLVKYQDPSQRELLEKSIKSIRGEAWKKLTHSGSRPVPYLIAVLEFGLDHENSAPDQLVLVVSALAKISDRFAETAVLKAARSSRAEVREAALVALAEGRHPEAIPLAIEGLADDSIAIRMRSEQVLRDAGHMGREAVVEALRFSTWELDEAITRAVPLFSMQPISDAVPPLCNLLRHPSAAVRRSVIRTFSTWGEALPRDLEVVKDWVRSSLADDDATVRGQAALALLSLGDSEELAQLVDLLKDPEENVRKSAEQALVGMTGLEDLAGSHEAWTRYLEDKNGR
ncbi:MAG: HEAT repeat domain-containing protein, partial [Planctomycetota bacterium]|nr:HEAT repeat domain-containing protein [Planctomycetota bacterium]